MAESGLHLRGNLTNGNAFFFFYHAERYIGHQQSETPLMCLLRRWKGFNEAAAFFFLKSVPGTRLSWTATEPECCDFDGQVILFGRGHGYISGVLLRERARFIKIWLRLISDALESGWCRSVCLDSNDTFFFSFFFNFFIYFSSDYGEMPFINTMSPIYYAQHLVPKCFFFLFLLRQSLRIMHFNLLSTQRRIMGPLKGRRNWTLICEEGREGIRVVTARLLPLESKSVQNGKQFFHPLTPPGFANTGQRPTPARREQSWPAKPTS